MAKTKLISKKLFNQILDEKSLIDCMKETLVSISEGKTAMLQRMMLPAEEGNLFALMTAKNDSSHIIGSKVIVFPGPVAGKNDTARGLVPVYDSVTGAILAIVDGEGITVRRTAATSAAATDALAKKDAPNLAILGCGRQGKAHAVSISKVRDLKTVTLWDKFPEAAKAAAEYLQKMIPGVTCVCCDDVKSAVENADIICTCVGKCDAPFLEGEWVKPGCHINAVGACSGDCREMDTATVVKSKIYLDYTPAALRDGGDVVIPLKNGELDESAILGEIGNVLNGTLKGRESDEEITLFETVGLAVEDLECANLVYRLAEKFGFGTDFDFDLD